MSGTEQLIKIIDFWKKTSTEGGLFWRSIVDNIDCQNKEIIDIVGPRRSGKSTILKLLINKLNLENNYLFINFEDPYFVTHNQTEIIEELISTYEEYFDKKLEYLFFDEIQNILNWEKAVRKLREINKYKIFITGSSSKLLSKELSSSLTGRHLSYYVMPLSFIEFLTFKQISIKSKKDLVLKEKNILKHFDNFLLIGGFPEIVKTENITLLKQYYFDIVQKDIIMRYDVRQKDILEKMGIYLISNTAKIISIESLKITFNLSYEAVFSYLEYFKEAFLNFELLQFSYSLKNQFKTLKKNFAVDTGLANAVSFKFSEDKGRILEQSVFLELKRRGSEIYYYKTSNNKEVDFLIKQKNKKQILIQVCWDLNDEKTKKREIDSLNKAMEELNIDEGLILTHNFESKILVTKKTINILPTYKWMLNYE